MCHHFFGDTTVALYFIAQEILLPSTNKFFFSLVFCHLSIILLTVPLTVLSVFWPMHTFLSTELEFAFNTYNEAKRVNVQTSKNIDSLNCI